MDFLYGNYCGTGHHQGRWKGDRQDLLWDSTVWRTSTIIINAISLEKVKDGNWWLLVARGRLLTHLRAYKCKISSHSSKLKRSQMCLQAKTEFTVLGSARIGLIFTKSQGGTQSGQLTQTGQTNWLFDTMWSHAWFWGGRAGQEEVNRSSGVRRASDSVLCVFHYFCIYFLDTVTVPFLCCSVKLPLSQPTSFDFLFWFPSPPQRGRGDRVATWSFVARWG